LWQIDLWYCNRNSSLHAKTRNHWSSSSGAHWTATCPNYCFLCPIKLLSTSLRALVYLKGNLVAKKVCNLRIKKSSPNYIKSRDRVVFLWLRNKYYIYFFPFYIVEHNSKFCFFYTPVYTSQGNPGWKVQFSHVIVRRMKHLDLKKLKNEST
jgi:hypothetical protein